MSEPGDGSWAKPPWPVRAPGPVGEPAQRPPDRVAQARRRGEAQLDDGAGLIALIIAGGYGAVLYVGILSTWFKWPALAVVLVMLWRHRPRRRRHARVRPPPPVAP